MSTIVDAWPAAFRALYGGGWPATYVTFDLETSGYAFDKDVITEIAHCLVEDGEVVDELSLVLDWTDHAVVPDHWLRSRLRALEDGMASAGKTCAVNYARMKAEGIDPQTALAHYRDLFAVFRERGVVAAAHNGYGFDEKMLHAAFVGFGVDPAGFRFDDNGLLDTDCIEKASQIMTNDRAHPRPGDTLRSYFHRVKYTRVSGVRSNLEDHCFRKYDFAARGVTPEGMHTALVDARCVHYVMEGIRARLAPATAANPGSIPPWIATTPSPSIARSARPGPASTTSPRTPTPRPGTSPGTTAGRRYRGQRNR